MYGDHPFQSQLNPLSANPTKWSKTQTIRRLLPTNCLNVFNHFVGLALKGLSDTGRRPVMLVYVHSNEINEKFDVDLWLAKVYPWI